MKLLFDQNISHRIVSHFKSVNQSISQVRLLGLENSSDIEIWEFAKDNEYTIVTFDTDFYDISSLKGHPPKIIWLRIGNTSTDGIKQIIESHFSTIMDFICLKEFENQSCLEIN